MSSAQKSSGSQPTSVASSSITSTVINLNPITGNKFFAVKTLNKNSYALYSYDDFKKQYQDLNAKGDEKFIQEFIFKNLDSSFTKSDILKKGEFRELNSFNRFNEMLNKFTESNFEKHNYIILEKKTGKKENKLIHKTGPVIINGKIRQQDEYFLSDGTTSFYGGYHYTIKVSK